MVQDQAYYSKGYKKEVSNTHAWRTVDNAVPFIIPVIKPNFKVLDVGCGPGTITVDIGANYLTEGGSVIGVEPTQQVLDSAEAHKKKYAEEHNKNLDNILFQTGSIYELPFEDNTFDLVHAHQVVVHLQDPIAGLKELRRVTKPGGFVCVKDSDLESSIVYPEEYQLIQDYYVTKAKSSGCTDPKAGRRLRWKAIQAGYESGNIKTSVSNWLLGDDPNMKHRLNSLIIPRAESGADDLYPDDLEKSKKARSEYIELLKKFADDENASRVVTNYDIVYQK
ncbi:putative SAM-dependent methyltransferase [Spathaspora passalidarum NRRL Y-27907]|uniref:Putative SAM-dependent methyltransferase n=1 Tax=Spathaspora passalidarum (strain NRRL Y-27907 / 11-Y1) TaxID=619300 RepID=G3AIJ4_SPAPN|nr:putative SAM-dependent methyltransferase [Spathaspora passalidarum NRRL Y-27907]EGW33709.1 putative SAM-dependent methyltransferase [Spathaspora passalidarum NRRL Y-27907]